MRIPTPATATAALALLLSTTTCAAVAAQGNGKSDRSVSPQLFAELEEAARLADIAYCVGISGIWKPFGCLSRCGDFPDFELVDTWNTGPLRSDSCGYIALDHTSKRIIVAFRGTYSLASALADLATTPQVYVPYPEPPPSASTPRRRRGWLGWLPWFGGPATGQNILAAIDIDQNNDKKDPRPVCTNCTVHAGFLTAWTHTRPLLLPHLAHLASVVPDYSIHLIGHSLGGALAALAGLELRAKGVEVVVTTFGEPRIGNVGLAGYLDSVFGLGEEGGGEGKAFRRVTHVDDPVPLLPLEEWGYRMHAGEIYVSTPHLPFRREDVEMCVGDEDERCIAGADAGVEATAVVVEGEDLGEPGGGGNRLEEKSWGLASRLKVWQLLFAHRDYFWRIGLCVPGGDPAGWGRGWYAGLGGGKGGGGVDEL